MDLSLLPALNATLNGVAASLLVTGFGFIRAKRIAAHRACMLAAAGVSVLFLISYLYYHAHAGMTRFQSTGWLRTAYFALLTSHTILAALTPPLVTVTLVLGLRRRDESHRRLARWTLPIWLYVSITGVLVYVMLYHIDR